MDGYLALTLKFLLNAGGVLLVANEIRGLILAAPVLYGMYQMGGSAMAIWLGICSLGGIFLSVLIPWIMARKLSKYLEKRQQSNVSA